MRNLNKAVFTIHAVHARGLLVFIPKHSDGELDGLKWMAEQTGGRIFYNRNDLGTAVQEAMQDGEVSYTLGFYSQHEKADGSFHMVKVKVDRVGVDVRHREGYFDIEPGVAPLDSAICSNGLGVFRKARARSAWWGRWQEKGRNIRSRCRSTLRTCGSNRRTDDGRDRRSSRFLPYPPMGACWMPAASRSTSTCPKTPIEPASRKDSR